MVRSGEKTQWLLFWQLAIFSTISASTRQEQEFWHLKTCFTSSMTMKLLIFNTGNAMSVYFCNILFIRTIYPKSYPISSLHKHTHTHTYRMPDFVAWFCEKKFWSFQKSKNRLHKASHSSIECVVRITARPSMVLEILISSGRRWVVPYFPEKNKTLQIPNNSHLPHLPFFLKKKLSWSWKRFIFQVFSSCVTWCFR